MEQTKPTKIFLKDIPGTVTYLVAHGITVDYVREPNGRVVASVDGSEEVYRLLAEFQTNPTVKVLDFLEVQRRERGKMLDMRDELNGNGRMGYAANSGRY